MKRNRKANWILKSIVVTCVAAMLFSCEPDIKTVKIYGEIDTLPELVAHDIEYVRSDSGDLQARLTSPLMHQYAGDDSYFEFPEGFKVVFYDSVMEEQSVLTADYGIGHDREKIMEARGNVVVINHEKQEKLETEVLTWDQREKKIFTYERVKITTPTDVLIGDTLISNESFSQYELKNTSGLIMLEDEEK
ncbi:MAG: LPS export ABC transporter periplasmic protein LptC [Bacteroidales bacterium]|nr:LPS export ABC transporter periplasmic protein LptC [Bacteroidales bacterium]MCF8343718.1 LPS export ABC transporter periplasmic protein LptC [Bacteroidales bacterium]MCF8350442.1 LPS export ABC transporter periplasmic protein LptC [Bacteroidales bacterium]MCF8376191.1 LPS export ABC transporter periplasmic protein LptC [Bacteroidales bacterium]MCF8401143.1 LPS export ABC transporter periplasmic protein LptC [Bacteroidales bacterium]